RRCWCCRYGWSLRTSPRWTGCWRSTRFEIDVAPPRRASCGRSRPEGRPEPGRLDNPRTRNREEDAMKIAAAAYPIDWHNRWNDFVGKLRVWVRTAAEQGAELLVFPEYAAMELASLAEEANS